MCFTEATVAKYLPVLFNPGTIRNKTKKCNFRPSSLELIETFLLHVAVSQNSMFCNITYLYLIFDGSFLNFISFYQFCPC